MLLQEGMETLPAMLTYVIGAVLAALFFFAGYKKFHFVLFAAAYTIANNFLLGYLGDRMVALGVALLIAILCVTLVRIMVVLLTSFMGSAIAVTLIGAMLPAEVTMMQMQSENDFALVLALGLTVIFALVQFLFSRFYKAE
jgi:hypothetical protein